MRPPPVSPTQHPSHSHVSINIKPGSSMTSSSWANPRRPGRLGNQSQAARRAEQPITGGLVDCNQEGNRTFDLCTTFVRYLKNPLNAISEIANNNKYRNAGNIAKYSDTALLTGCLILVSVQIVRRLSVCLLTSRSIHGSSDLMVQLWDSSPAKL